MRPRYADDDVEDEFEPFEGGDVGEDEDDACDDYGPQTLIVRDPYGVMRELTEDGGGQLVGYHDIGDGMQPYWLPRAIVETWERVL